jgi:hypothetical protein
MVKKFFFGLVSIAALTLGGVYLQPGVVTAACDGFDCVDETIQKTQSGTKNSTDVESLAGKITVVLLYLIGGVSVIMIAYGGFRYITSNGDASSIKAAKDTILYSAIGLLVALAAWALVDFVFNFI